MWDMWLIDDWSKKTVDNRLFGIEPKLAEQMRNMPIGETLWTTGYYRFQIIRKL